MKKKIVWLVVSCLMVLSLLVVSCAPAVTEEEEVAPTPHSTEDEAETPPSPTRIEKLPYSWTEGVFLITIEDFFKYEERGTIAETYDWYKLSVSYRNTSHNTAKTDINIGTFKLRTDKENLYDIKYVGCLSSYFTLDPQQSYESDSCSFRIQKGEKPVELWFYKTIGEEYGWPKYAEEPSIIFKLETQSTPITPSTLTLTMGKLKVHFIDVGQGDSILVDLGQIEILIDGGGKSSGVTAYLNDYVDGPLEVMIATHPHADHIGGLIAVLGAFDVQQIWHNGDLSTSKTYAEFMAAVESENTDVHIAKLRDTIEVGELSFYVHHPSRTFDSINNNSIVLHLAYGNTDFLFTGDAEKEAEGAMMALSSVRIPEVEILKIGHHGSRTASSKAFLAITSPEIAIYMAKEGNSYGHPHEETVQALNEIGAEIYGTDIHGTIVVITDGETYKLQLERPAEPFSTTESSPPSTSTTTPTVTTNVKITKIFYDGFVPRVESDEYVEITNLGSEQVDLAGWVLKDIDEGYPSFTFPSYILQPRQSVRVYTNEIHPEWGGFTFGYGKAIWNNTDHDTAALFDAEGQEVSRRSY